MGISIMDLNDKQKGMMKDSDRKSFGREGMTGDEAKKRFQKGEEKKLQALISNYLNLHGIWFTWQRTDKRATSRVGTPDFLCVKPGGTFLAVEAKASGGTLSREQAVALSEIRNLGGIAIVAYTLQDVIDALNAS